jgi:hypothetical protein
LWWLPNFPKANLHTKLATIQSRANAFKFILAFCHGFCSKTHAKTYNHPSFLQHAYACRYYYGTPPELFILNAFALQSNRNLGREITPANKKTNL